MYTLLTIIIYIYIYTQYIYSIYTVYMYVCGFNHVCPGILEIPYPRLFTLGQPREATLGLTRWFILRFKDNI